LFTNIFSKDDFENAIEECNFSKSIGADGFDGTCLKDPDVKRNLIEYLLDCTSREDLPLYLNEGKLVLLSKSDSPIAKIEETRPIAVLSHISKIVEKAILAKLKSTQSKLMDVGRY